MVFLFFNGVGRGRKRMDMLCERRERWLVGHGLTEERG